MTLAGVAILAQPKSKRGKPHDHRTVREVYRGLFQAAKVSRKAIGPSSTATSSLCSDARRFMT